jgi:hypothetical protein
MSSARVWAVEVGGVGYSVRASVARDGREHSAAIESVTRGGVEIDDAEFEPIAGQLEGAVIDAHAELAAAAREAMQVGGAL